MRSGPPGGRALGPGAPYGDSMRNYARSRRKLAKSARASENLRPGARKRDGCEDMQTVTNCLSQTLHLFAFMCAHAIYSHNRQSRVRTPQPPTHFFSLAACGDVSLCHSTQRHGLIAGISVFSVSKYAMSAGAVVGRGVPSPGRVVCENIHPPPQQNGPACENMQRRPPARIAKICAPQKSYYPRMPHAYLALGTRQLMRFGDRIAVDCSCLPKGPGSRHRLGAQPGT